jgi:hypothetical protein
MSMNTSIRRSDLIWLVVNSIVLGGCFVLMALRGPDGPLVLLTVGTAGMLLGKIGRVSFRPRESSNAEMSGKIIDR